jgi:hypothetical protein
MTSDEDRGTEQDLDRIVYFSDALFAIAITVLVLEIRVPEGPGIRVSELLAPSLIALWPKYLGYVISFLRYPELAGLSLPDVRGLPAVPNSPDRRVRGSSATRGDLRDHARGGQALAHGALLVRDERGQPDRRRHRSGTVRFFFVLGLTIPLIFLISVVSFFNANAAVASWFLLMAVDAVILYRRGHRPQCSA